MWSQGRFKSNGAEHDDMAAFAGATAALGFGHIEINYVIPPAGVEALLATNHVGVSSVHSPCPRVKTPSGRMSDALNLASPDAEERELAVECARAAVDVAVRAGAPAIVVHLGGVGSEIFPEERELRKLYDAGTREGEQVESLLQRADERRQEGFDTYFPQARRSLDEITEYAAPRGVAVGLENRYHFHEFPGPDDMHELLAAYPPEAAGFWLDIGHAEVLDRLGFHRHTRWLDELGTRCIGAHVHDVEGLADHRAPGHGTADWPHYASKLPAHTPRVFEINQRTPEEQVSAAIPFLRERGILPAAP
jgi:sugar phosphate isomerase/epimerase